MARSVMTRRLVSALLFFLVAGVPAMSLNAVPANTGTITGKVTYTGTRPKDKPIDMSKGFVLRQGARLASDVSNGCNRAR